MTWWLVGISKTERQSKAEVAQGDDDAQSGQEVNDDEETEDARKDLAYKLLNHHIEPNDLEIHEYLKEPMDYAIVEADVAEHGGD